MIKRYWYIIISLVFIHGVAMAQPLPKIFAHAGGGDNWPRNTLFAFMEATKAGVDALELDVQVSKDGQVVVYHGNNLSIFSNGAGKISDLNLKEIQKFTIKCTKNVKCPTDSTLLKIPTLLEALKALPENTLFIIDMKSTPEADLANALIKTIPNKYWNRLVFYSTNKPHYEALLKGKPKATVFEDRDTTRNRAVGQLLGANTKEKYQNIEKWVGYELIRKMTVTEKFNLGEGSGEFNVTVWNKDTIARVRETYKKVNLVFFGINNVASYQKAIELGADAVFTEDPLALIEYRNEQQKK